MDSSKNKGIHPLVSIYQNSPSLGILQESLASNRKLSVQGLKESAKSAFIACAVKNKESKQLVVLNDKEEAAYFFNDLENMLGSGKVLFFPASSQTPYQNEEVKNANVVQRAEVLSELSLRQQKIIVSYPEALFEYVVTNQTLNNNSFSVNRGEKVSMAFVTELLFEYNFERTQFVVEPGQFAVRGGIIDIWSYSSDRPFRLDFFGNEVESIKSFDPATQLSVAQFSEIILTPNLNGQLKDERRCSFMEYLGKGTLYWINDVRLCRDKLDAQFAKAEVKFEEIESNTIQSPPSELFSDGSELIKSLENESVIELNKEPYFEGENLVYEQKIQPNFNKNFQLLIEDLNQKQKEGFDIYIAADNPKQIDRIEKIFEDFEDNGQLIGKNIEITPIHSALQGGFIDEKEKFLVYTDHQIFGRYHRFKLKDNFKKSKQAITLKELTSLKKGDYITHIDYGIGIFDGLETVDKGGKKQEAIRLRYKDQDVLYVNIQSLHRISKFAGKDSKEPKINKLGTTTWKTKKAATKKKVKEIAYDLIQLYAKRKAAKGHAYQADNYMQIELEASFIYEDTPDQEKATKAVKEDMEKSFPMDRLVCGDVGFGKTEIAIRAAFKAALDGKQTAILVPTTILAFQHWRTFKNRLKDFPVNVDYINRFRSAKQVKESLDDLASGKTDIIIGTHRLVSKQMKYKDLGLLIIDEEQKFGVSVKDKLKTLKANLDTLTLTATPIPRTLQFSLLGSRDLSVINTPPPNRFPVETVVCGFNPETVRDALSYELSRGGQAYFIHNRVENIKEVAGTIQKLLPDAKIAVGHGQMKGEQLEKVMMDFMNHEYDILVATTIIESGLDISNVNTILINQAQNFGLSDLHQMRGRVGRSNKKAFCFLIAPPLSALTDEARKRLRALEEFSELGSGFNIAMRDLDIRGAGDLLGAEQSGFMSEIGYETYQKILDEAIEGLKESDFKELFVEELTSEERIFVRDCQIECDQELLLPTTYVNAVDERLKLYKELDSISDETALEQYRLRLIDRFGELPEPAENLLAVMKLRWLGKTIGFEKIKLLNSSLKGYFVSDPASEYYNSEKFSRMLQFVQLNMNSCTMKEVKGRLTLSFANVSNFKQAEDCLNSLATKLNQQEAKQL